MVFCDEYQKGDLTSMHNFREYVLYMYIITNDVKFGHLVKVMSTMFCHYKVIFPPW